MKISKRSYARLTLPWRVVGNWGLFQRIEPPYYTSFVTGCQIFWLRVMYPFAWLLVIPALLGVWALLASIVCLYPLLWPLMKLDEYIGGLRSRCRRVEWIEPKEVS